MYLCLESLGALADICLVTDAGRVFRVVADSSVFHMWALRSRWSSETLKGVLVILRECRMQYAKTDCENADQTKRGALKCME